MIRHHLARLLAAALVSITIMLPLAIVPATAASERALYLYYTHTKETARIVFKRNGQYVQSGLNELNVFLRDWRRNEPAKMDPRLFDLVWEVYQEVGSNQPVNVVSAYRSPATNAMLAKTSSGVADDSQHMRGTAMDFFIPGVALPKLRAAAMRRQVGGVGYYPTSGSPFVHLDVGSVRAWPRMTRAQLKDLFPDGKTMHLPLDGKPLSQEGYQVALAEWKRCHAYPCNGTSSNSGTQVADSGGGGRTLMDLFFGGDDKAAGKPAPQTAAKPVPAPMQVAAIAPQQATPIAAPVPALRPASLLGGAPVAVAAIAPTPVAIPFSTSGSAPLDPSELATAPVIPMPVMKSAALQAVTARALPSGDAVTAIAALTAPVPQPRLIMSAPAPETMTAYLAQDPEAQRALEMIIDRETTTAATPLPAKLPPLIAATGLRTASLGGQPTVSAMDNLFSGTFGAARQDAPIAAALAEHITRRPVPGAMRSPELIAPDLEHVADVFGDPAQLSSAHYANIWDHDEADFDPTTELGRYVTVMGVGDVPATLSHTKFVTTAPLALASN